MAEGTLRVALVGIGNCVPSLLQGLVHYGATSAPGLLHDTVSGYRIADIVPAAAFDVAVGKVGHDLAEAILAPSSNTACFAAVPPTGVTVARGPTLDGIGHSLTTAIRESDAPVADVAGFLRRALATLMADAASGSTAPTSSTSGAMPTS